MTGLLLFGLVIMLSVGIHEYGHYLAMVRNGVRVISFQINVGPTLKAWTLKNGTVFSIRLIPLGGLAMPVPDGPDGIEGKSRWARFQIYVAGMVMNCLLGMAVLLVMGYGFGVMPEFLVPLVKWAPGWLRIPAAAVIGSFGFWLATPLFIWKMLSDTGADAGVVGPVGIAHMGIQAAASAVSVKDLVIKGLMYLWSINLALAMSNLIPIPMLDGGRILMLAFERWLSKRTQQLLTAGSALMLIAILIYATYGDIVRLLTS